MGITDQKFPSQLLLHAEWQGSRVIPSVRCLLPILSDIALPAVIMLRGTENNSSQSGSERASRHAGNFLA